MPHFLSQFSTPAFGLAATLGLGLWLSKAGRPYPGLLFNLHKLIALATVILMGLRTYPYVQSLARPGALMLSLGLVVLGVVVLFGSGAFLSIGNLEYRAMKVSHQIALALVIACMGWSLYLLAG